MKITRLTAGVAVVAVGALALSGCTPPRESEVIEDTSLTIAWNDYYYAFNDGLADTNALANNVVNYIAKSGFFYYDNTPELVKNEDFGTYEVVEEDPLTVKYTINDGVTWADGTAVDAADLLLIWAANTTHRQDGEGVEDEETGDLTGQTGTFWNTGALADYALDLVGDVPAIGDDGRSATFVYDEFYVDWELAFSGPDVSAHGTVALAYPDEYAEGDEQQAKDDLVQAIQDNDLEWLAPVSKAYNQAYKFSNGAPDNAYATLGNGAYNISEINSTDGYVTLTAREDYVAGPSPKYESITVRVIPETQDQITALQNDEVQIAGGQPTADIASQLAAGIDNVDYAGALQGSYEHLDLQAANGGPFDPATYGGDDEAAKKVRQAFLKVVPRQEIVDKLIVPLQEDAEVRNTLVFTPGTEGAAVSEETNGWPEAVDPDVAGAQALLAEAGVTTPVDVRLLFSSTNPRRQSEYELIQPIAAEAGFNLINASSQDWSARLSTATTTYDAALFAWIEESSAVGGSAANFQVGGLNNFYGWDNATVDSLFTQLAGEIDPAEQQNILVEAEQLISEEAWSVPIFTFPGLVAWRSDRVSGVQPGYFSPEYIWNFWDWTPVEAEG